MNTITVTGRLVSDAKTQRIGDKNTPLCEFTIADNEYPDNVNYWDCKLFNRENLAQYLKKGTLLTVSGTVLTDRYETKDGEKRSRMNIRIDQAKFPMARKKSDVDKNEASGAGTEDFVPVPDDFEGIL